MSVLSMSLSGLRLCNVHTHTLRLAEQFIRVDVISFTHWPIIGSAHFFHMCVCVCKHIFHFILYSHRSSGCVPIAISSLSPSSVSIFFFLFSLSCLPINSFRSRYLSYLSLLEFSESSRCWLQGNSNVSFRSRTTHRPVNRQPFDEMSVLCDVNSFATCLAASKAAQTQLLPAKQ